MAQSLVECKSGNYSYTGPKSVKFLRKTKVDPIASVTTQAPTGGTGVKTYNSFNVPSNPFGCSTSCLSGTSTSASAGTSTWQFANNALGTGITNNTITWLLYAPAAGTYTVNTAIGSSATSAFSITASDQYVYTVVATSAGFYPVTVDLSQLPDLVTGGGYVNAALFTHLQISVTSPVVGAGVSSISLLESYADLQCAQVIKAFCVDSVTGDNSITNIAQACQKAKASGREATVSMTINQITGDLKMLDPGMKKTENASVLKPVTREVVAQSITINGEIYAYIDLGTNANINQCLPVDALIAGLCGPNGKGLQLQRICSDFTGQIIPDGQFVLWNGVNGSTVAGRLLMDDKYIGQKICTSYFTSQTSTKYSASGDMQDLEVSLFVLAGRSDGKTELWEYPDVLLTSGFGPNFSKTDATQTEVEFTVNPNENNDYYYIHEIN